MDTDDYYALELVLSTADLIRAETFEEIERAFNEVVDRAQQLTREKYGELSRRHANEVKAELHDEAIQAQGGL